MLAIKFARKYVLKKVTKKERMVNLKNNRSEKKEE